MLGLRRWRGAAAAGVPLMGSMSWRLAAEWGNVVRTAYRSRARSASSNAVAARRSARKRGGETALHREQRSSAEVTNSYATGERGGAAAASLRVGQASSYKNVCRGLPSIHPHTLGSL